MTASAEDLLQVEPFATTKGVVGTEVNKTMWFNLNCDDFKVNSIRFYVYLPAGLKFDDQYDVDGATDTAIPVVGEDPYGNKPFDAARVGTGFSATGHQAGYTYLGTENGYNKYVVLIHQGTKLATIKGTSGHLLQVYYSTSSTMADGVYPIYIKNLELSNTESLTTITIPEVSSYVKIGSPKNQTLAPTGCLPKFVATALETETAVTSLDLSECDYIPAEGIAPKATVNYTRAVSDEWGTICLPFELTSDENIQYYAFESMSDNELNVKAVDKVAAGTPAVFKATTPGTLNWSSDNVAKAAINNGDMTGTYEKLTDQTGMYFIAQNKFWYAEVPITIGSFRAYFPTSAKGASLRINVIDPNGIQKLEMDENGNIKEVFNLQGQHIAAPVKGQVNIINGKKVIVK